MKTVHIFYNGEEAHFPENNDWEKFLPSIDTVRVFLICAESWRQHGFDVKRVSTENFVSRTILTNEKEEGKLDRYLTWYPYPRWTLWEKLLTIGEDYFLVATLDVLNVGLWPADLPPESLLWSNRFPGAISFQSDHFSTSCLYCTRAWIVDAIEILRKYDCGELPLIPGKYVSDETILRHYATYELMPVQKFPLSNYKRAQLLHFARSTLKTAYESIPTV